MDDSLLRQSVTSVEGGKKSSSGEEEQRSRYNYVRELNAEKKESHDIQKQPM